MHFAPVMMTSPSTGMADEVTLAKRFGIEIQSVAFWRSSLDVIRGQIGEFEGLVG